MKTDNIAENIVLILTWVLKQPLLIVASFSSLYLMIKWMTFMTFYQLIPRNFTLISENKQKQYGLNGIKDTLFLPWLNHNNWTIFDFGQVPKFT